MSGFMQLQVWCENGVEIRDPEDARNTVMLPASYVDDSWHDRTGYVTDGLWFAEYSAPGYMDRTDFVSSKIGPIDAAYQAFGLFGDDEPHSEDRRELARVIRQARAQGYRK